MAPPATPSPHRFVAPRPSKPPSSLRKQFAPGPSSSQFAPTPKFSLRSSDTGDARAEAGTSPLTERKGRVAAFKLKKGEEIEDAEAGDEERVSEMREVGDGEEEEVSAALHEPTGTRTSRTAHPQRALKRRRSSATTAANAAESTSTILISDDDEDARSTSSTQSEPNDQDPTSSRPLPQRPPRFTFHPPHPPPNRPTTPPRPAFILPTPTAAEPSYPLPEAFSPHRRGAKYLPGGLAATTRGWILSIESTLPSHAHPRPSFSASANAAREGEWAARIKVEECRDGGECVLVWGLGMEGDGEAQRWVLVGGKGVRRGDVVGVGRPVWGVQVWGDGERWSVGVEWRVL
ncbi:hypothetical protein MMC30_006752 [Trapelia coarctata]|nr:hypothetical protein [Trapelia coarctata]